MEGVEFVNRVLSTTETETYFCACDIVFIQRFSVLNYGNLPMGFGAGCVVVGPNVGNVGSILNKTGNPIFNPYDIDSIVLAIKKAKELLSVNKGKKIKCMLRQNGIRPLYLGSWQRFIGVSKMNRHFVR